MPDVYGPFTGAAWQQGGWYRDAWARGVSGVYGGPFASSTAGDLGLTVSGLNVTMALGRGHVRGASYERTGTAWTYAVPANTATNPRVDRLVLRRDLAAQTVVPFVLQGTPAASPSAPALTQVEDGVWDLPLFRFTVPANSGAPVTGIVDERPAVGTGRVGGDTGWVSITPNAGFTAAESLAYRVFDGVCQLRGAVTRTAGNYPTAVSAVFTLPVAPSAYMRWPLPAGLAANVQTSGLVEVFADSVGSSTAAASIARLSAVSFFLN